MNSAEKVCRTCGETFNKPTRWTSLSLHPVDTGDDCNTVTITIPTMQQMNAATSALARIDALAKGGV